MTTDIKTLADAQPGGRVRLGDQAERARFEAWAESEGWYAVAYRPYRDAPYALNAVEFAWQAWQAALSAKPSPGGQGDSRSEKAATFLRQYLTYLRSSPRQGLRPRWCDVYEALEVAIEALTARQPSKQPDSVALGEATEFCSEKGARQPAHGSGTLVDSGALQMALNVLRRAGKDEVADALESTAARQPVGADGFWLAVDDDGFVHFGQSTDGNNGRAEVREVVECRIHDWLDNEGRSVDLVWAGSKPAQAVDLSGVREAVRKAWQKCAAGESVDLQFGTLLALIDSQAVGEPVAYTSETQLKAVRLCGDGIMSQRNAKWDIPLYLRPAQAVDLPYSLDTDPAGIRARVCDVITGTLMVGAQGHTPPPAGHWAEPFWKAARADAAAQAVDLSGVREAVRKAWQKCAAGESVDLQFGTLLALIDSQGAR